MNQLIHSGPSITMSSREIADLTGKDVSHIHRDIRSMLDELRGHDPEVDDVREDRDQRGYTTCFHLTKGLSMTLVAGYNVRLRKAIIDRWQELEAQVAAPTFQVPTTLSGALRLAAEQAEKIEEQQRLIEQQKPAVEFVDRYVNVATGEKGFREVCKILGANEARFREFLVAERIMYRLQGRMMAYQNHIDAGRFRITTGISEDTNHAYTNVKMTPKGVEWVAGEWAKYKLSQSGLLD